MKGQKLVVRWSEAGDEDQVRRLYETDGTVAPEMTAAMRGAVARLVGDVVGHAVLSPREDELALTSLYVAKDLRGRRIGRLFLQELARLASAEGSARIVPENESLLEFFRRTGFAGSTGSLRSSNEHGAGV